MKTLATMSQSQLEQADRIARNSPSFRRAWEYACSLQEPTARRWYQMELAYELGITNARPSLPRPVTGDELS